MRTSFCLKVHFFWDVMLCCWVCSSQHFEDSSAFSFRVKQSRMPLWMTLKVNEWWYFTTSRILTQQYHVTSQKKLMFSYTSYLTHFCLFCSANFILTLLTLCRVFTLCYLLLTLHLHPAHEEVLLGCRTYVYARTSLWELWRFWFLCWGISHPGFILCNRAWKHAWRKC